MRQALEYVESGNVEAAFVGKALTKGSKSVAIEIDQALHDPIVQSLGIVERSDNKTAANIFLRYLQSEKGAEVLKEYGFKIPPVTDKTNSAKP